MLKGLRARPAALMRKSRVWAQEAAAEKPPSASTALSARSGDGAGPLRLRGSGCEGDAEAALRLRGGARKRMRRRQESDDEDEGAAAPGASAGPSAAVVKEEAAHRGGQAASTGGAHGFSLGQAVEVQRPAACCTMSSQDWQKCSMWQINMRAHDR